MDPVQMVEYTKLWSSDRKLRLFACSLLKHYFGSGHPAWEISGAGERLADGLATPDENRWAQIRVLGEGSEGWQAAWITVCDDVKEAILPALRHEFVLTTGYGHDQLCHFMQDIFGNPFSPVAFDPRWRSADTVALAQGIYEDRAFDRLPLLADALMGAGCDDEQVIGHCRGDGPHVRGCWVVDLVLGKE